MRDVGVVIAAAGQGRRMNNRVNKVLLELQGRPIIQYSLDVFCRMEEVAEIVVVAHPDEVEIMSGAIRNYSAFPGKIKVVSGGRQRQDSVRAGLEALCSHLNVVAVHDGARPLISIELAAAVIAAARQFNAACPGIPTKDTLKVAGDDGWISQTLDRSRIFKIQTPQAFRLDMLKTAYHEAAEAGFSGTDDAVIFEKFQGQVRMVVGEERNIKITTNEDLTIANVWLTGGRKMRVGTGYDVHRLVGGRPLIVGGVNIPHPTGLMGHSDADVLTHAVCDALLGAAGLPDIGHQFPDNDPRFKGISSLELLAQVGNLLAKNGYSIVNIDSVIIAEKPRMAPYLQDMVKCLAGSLMTAEERITIKATTTEGLGFTGRGEGIAAQATVLLE